MLFELSKFDEYREDNRREVKKGTNGLPVSLWESYSSFANSYGGVIIIGVKENKDGSWSTTGLKDERKLLKNFWDTINNKKKVNVNLLTDSDVQTYTENETGNVIIVITVPVAAREQRPVYINSDIWNGTFRRNWEGDYHCTTAEIKAMLRDQPNETMDMKVIDKLTVMQLNQNTVRSYRNRHRLVRPGHTWSNLSDEEYLEMIGAAAVGEDKKLHPTAAGLLMFGDEFRIVREFPEYFLDYREMLDPAIRWTDRFYSSTGEWSGNLFDFYFGVYNRIIRELKVPFKMVGGERIDDTPVHKAIREVLANCLVNTDFYAPRGVVIKKDCEHLVLENPGYIRVGKVQMRKGGESDPRNKALMKMFNMIDIGERAGSGVPELFSVWEQEGWEEPMIEERFGEAARTSITLSFKKRLPAQNEKVPVKSAGKKVPVKNADKKLQRKTLKQLEMIKDYLKKAETCPATELCDLLKVRDRRVRQLLKYLEENGQIEVIGTYRNRRYRLK